VAPPKRPLQVERHRASTALGAQPVPTQALERLGCMLSNRSRKWTSPRDVEPRNPTCWMNERH